MSLFSLCFCCFCWDGRKRDFVCKVWCPSQCPHIVAFYITVQFLSEFSVPLGTHSLLWRSRQHNAPYGAGGCHISSLCWVFLLFILGALLGSGTCVKGAPHVILACSRSLALQSAVFMEVGRRCVGAWGSPFLWCSLQASCSLRCSCFLSFLVSLSSPLLFPRLAFLFVFLFRFLWTLYPMDPLRQCTRSMQHAA